MPSPTTATIVVCTFNRAAMLRRAVESLTCLETEGRFAYDVLVVDNGSTDETPAVIEALSRSSAVAVRGVRETKEGVACARNRGIAEAAGEWIAFFDDDQEADPRWLLELLSLAEAKRARVAAGQNRLLLPDEVVRSLARPCRAMLGESVIKKAPCTYDRSWAPGTGNLLVHRTVFDEVGTFNEELREAGEDTDLYRRIYAARIAAWHAPTAIIYHAAPPYRLDDHYFRWKALRGGGHLARRDFDNHGRLKLALLLAARIAQASALHLPRLLWARLRGDAVAAQGMRCLLWRAEGYARFTFHFWAPRLFAQRRFMSGLEFRGERALLAPAAKPTL